MAEWTQEIRAKIIARTWKDENFRKKFIKNPKEVFKEYGINLPENYVLKVMTDDSTHGYFKLPPSPSQVQEMSQEELEKIAAAGFSCGGGWLTIRVGHGGGDV